jgi:hypothetical protein
MEENKKSIDGIIEKLALIADGIETLFPESKTAIAIELGMDEYKKVQTNFRKIDHHHKQFVIEISTTQFMFLLDESLNASSDKTLENPSQLEVGKDTSSVG